MWNDLSELITDLNKGEMPMVVFVFVYVALSTEKDIYSHFFTCLPSICPSKFSWKASPACHLSHILIISL
jgi:hypothetical protein